MNSDDRTRFLRTREAYGARRCTTVLLRSVVDRVAGGRYLSDVSSTLMNGRQRHLLAQMMQRRKIVRIGEAAETRAHEWK